MGVRFYIILFTFFFANFAFAQPKSRLAHCLTNAYEAMTENFKNDGKYSDAEEKLKNRLSEGCKALPYDITLKADNRGFRVVSEFNGETWSVDENQDFVRAAKLTPRKAAADPSAPPGAPAAPAMKRVPIVVDSAPSRVREKAKGDPQTDAVSTEVIQPTLSPPPSPSPAAKNAPAKIIPPAVLASDSTPPLVPVPQFVPNVNFVAAGVVKKGDDGATKLERCFTKRLFNTKACVTLFSDLDSQCAQGGDKIPTMCLDLNRHLAATHLDDCSSTGAGADENFGKCELKARQMKKVCANPMKEFTFECRTLTKYLTLNEKPAEAGPAKAEVPSALAAPKALRAPAAAPEAVDTLTPVPPVSPPPAAGYYTTERTSINAIRNVQSLDSALRKLLRLRPVSFESRETLQKDVGFVAEEVELVDPTYVHYTDKNVLHGVKVPQLTALIAGSVQEIYGMCRSDADLQKDLIKRLVTLEGENAELKREVERQTRELIIIKAKLGIK